MNIFKSFQNLYAPEDASLGTSGDADEFEEAINEIVDKGSKEDNEDKGDGEDANEDTNVEDDIFNDKELKPLEDGEDKEEKEEKEEEVEEEEDNEEEELEEDKSIKDDVIKSAKAKFPKLFKEFPELKDAFFRDKQYREHFPTPDDAREALENVENYNYVQQEITKGDPTVLVKFLEKSPKTIVKFGRSLIEQASKVNNELGAAIVFPHIANILKEASEDGDRAGNKNLKNSVIHLTNYLFGNSAIPEDSYKESKEDKDNKGESVDDANQRAYQVFAADVREETLEEFDKLAKGSLVRLNATPAVKRTICQDLFREVVGELNKDSSHLSKIKSLYSKAAKRGFTREDRLAIKTAWMETVNRIFPRIRVKVLKDNGYEVKKVKKGTVNKDKDKETNKQQFKVVKSDNNRAPTKSSRAGGKTSGKSDLEIMDELIGKV